VLVGALGFLGWKLLDQERDLERERLQERLGLAAESAVSRIRQELDGTVNTLRTIAASDEADRRRIAERLAGPRTDVVIVAQSPDGLWSSNALVFYPDQPDRTDQAVEAFHSLEAQELGDHTLPSVLAAYQRLAGSRDPTVRAGALLREARVARSLGQPSVALAAYRELEALGTTAAAGRPADLVALVERCSLLASSDRQSANLRQCAAELRNGFLQARWRLSSGEFHYFLEQATGWLGVPETPDLRRSIALADGVSLAWNERQATQSRQRAVQQTASSEPPVFVMSLQTDGRFAALVATPEYARRSWFRDLVDTEDQQRAQVTVKTAHGLWFGSGVSAPGSIERPESDTGLPFTVAVSTSDPAGDSAASSTRRRLLSAVFVTLALLLIAGGYIVFRGISRELEVARLQSDFVSAVSHEFRTPVASVRQLSEILADGRVADEERRHRYYGLLRRESERLQRLVEGLLDFKRMESHAAEYRFETLDPGALVQQVADEFRLGGYTRANRLSVSVAPGLPAVRCDREAFTRALWNLLDNAAKYAPGASPIAIDVAKSNGRVVVQVRDEGPGIPTDEQTQIFRKFVRGSAARSSGAKGTGLGLAMVSHIMKAHRGQITVASRPGAGSTFSLVLPVEGAAS
jgi:signal transduction histidine kinase